MWQLFGKAKSCYFFFCDNGWLLECFLSDLDFPHSVFLVLMAFLSLFFMEEPLEFNSFASPDCAQFSDSVEISKTGRQNFCIMLWSVFEVKSVMSFHVSHLNLISDCVVLALGLIFSMIMWHFLNFLMRRVFFSW